MEINQKIDFVEGCFETSTDEMHCIADDNHGKVNLCLKEQDCGWYIPIGEIKLYSRDRYVDFKATLDDAKKLGEEIARRWNECADKK